jgi:plastocyanin
MDMAINRLAALLAATLIPLSSGVAAATHDVSVGNNFFEPNDLTIQVGDTVRWTNNSGFHDVTADDGDWRSETSSSWVYTRTFNTAEEVRYYCSVHSAPGLDINTRMNGRINVVGANEPAFSINTALSDAWFDPATGGQGFFIIVWENSGVFLSWFTFDTERPPPDVTAVLGEPGHRWLTAQGAYEGDTATLVVSQTSGGVFDSADPPVDQPPLEVGTMNIVWTGCNAGTLSYDLPALNLTGNIPIQRIVTDNVPACEAAQPTQ